MMRLSKFLRKLLLFLLTLPVFFFIFFPILWLFSASLSTQVELFTVPIALDPAAPDLPELSRYHSSPARRPRPCRAPLQWPC